MNNIIFTSFVIICIVVYILYEKDRRYREKISYDNEQFRKNVDIVKSISKNLSSENKIMFPVLYINLDRCLQRKTDIEHQFKKYGINGTRISAIDGRNKNSGIDFKSDYNLTDSELGCVLSHLKAIKYAYDNNLDIVVIAEDDISLELMPFWTKTVYEITNESCDWDLIQLGNSSCDFSDSVINISYKKHEKPCYGCFFYVINRNGMKNIINNCFKNDKIELSSKNLEDRRGYADFLIFREAGKSKSYMKPLVFTTNTGSTIQDEHEIIALTYWNKVLTYYIKKFFSNVDFQNTWIINLDRDIDRLEHTRNRLENINIYSTRWRATDAKSDDFIKFYKDIPSPKRSIGEIACYISHMTLWKYIYDSNIPYAIIFEDDIILPKEIDKYEIIKRINDSPGFNILYLGHCYSNLNNFKTPYTKVGRAQCTHAYIISRNCIKNLLSKPNDFSLPIDKVLNNMCKTELCYISNTLSTHGSYGEGIIHQDNNFESSLKSNRGLIK